MPEKHCKLVVLLSKLCNCQVLGFFANAALDCKRHEDDVSFTNLMSSGIFENQEDLNGDGLIDRDEFVDMGFNAKDFDQYDVDGSGTLDKAEVEQLHLERKKEYMEKEESTLAEMLKSRMGKGQHTDKDGDGQIDDDEWRGLVGNELAVTKDQWKKKEKMTDDQKETQKEELYKAVCVRMEQVEKHDLKSETDQLRKLFEQYYKVRANFMEQYKEPIKIVKETVKAWEEQRAGDETYTPQIRQATQLVKDILDPAVDMDPQNMEMQLRTTAAALAVSSSDKDMIGAWLKLLDTVDSLQEPKRVLTFGCHQVSADVDRKLQSDFTDSSEQEIYSELANDIDDLVKHMRPKSIFGQGSTPSALAIDISLKAKAPSATMTLEPEIITGNISQLEKCYCADGTPCGRNGHEHIKFELGTVTIRSPPETDELGRRIQYTRRKNNQIKLEHSGLKCLAHVRSTAYSSHLMSEPLNIVHYPDKVIVVVEWDLWDKPKCIELRPENIETLKIDVFAYSNTCTEVAIAEECFDAKKKLSNGMLAVQIPPEITLFGFKVVQKLADLGNAGDQDQLQRLLQDQLSDFMPVNSLLPLKESEQVRLTLTTHFESLFKFEAAANDDSSSDDDASVLALIVNSVSVIKEGKDLTIECDNFEVDFNVAHFSDLVGALKPLFYDDHLSDQLKDLRKDTDLKAYELFLKEAIAKIPGCETLIRTGKEYQERHDGDAKENFINIARDNYSERPRIQIVVPSQKAGMPGFQLRMIKTHGTTDGMSIVMPQLLAILSDSTATKDHKVELEATALHVQLDGLTSMSLMEAHYKERVAQDPDYLEWQKLKKTQGKARDKAIIEKEEKARKKVIETMTELGLEMAQITKYRGTSEYLVHKPHLKGLESLNGKVKRISIKAANVLGRTWLPTQDWLFGEPRKERAIFAELYKNDNKPIHQLYASLPPEIWMDPLFESFEDSLPDGESKSRCGPNGEGTQSLSEFVAKGGNLTVLAADEERPYHKIVDDLIDHHVIGFENSTLLMNFYGTGGWFALVDLIMCLLYYKPASVNPDFLSALFKDLTVDMICMWPLCGLMNRTGNISTFE